MRCGTILLSRPKVLSSFLEGPLCLWRPQSLSPDAQPLSSSDLPLSLYWIYCLSACSGFFMSWNHSLWTSVSSLSTKHGVCGFVQLQLGLAPYSFSYFLCHLLVKGFYPPLRPHLHILHEVGQTGCPSVFCSCFLPLSTLVFDEGPCRGSIPFYKPAPSLSGLEIKDRGSPFLLLRPVWVPRYLWADLWGRKKGGDSSAPEGSLGLHRPTW